MHAAVGGWVALVTGGAGGIGAGCAAALAAAGATVVRADRLDADRHLDVTDEASCRAAVADVVDRHGRLDVLVNAAGIVRRGPAATLDDPDWDDVLAVNLTGTFRMCRAAFPALRAAGGAVVNVGSTNGQVAAPDTVAYCVSKAGVHHLTRVLALEWAADGVRVNAVAPTMVATAMTADRRADPVALAAKLATIPLGRMATVEDVAAAVVYLASPAAAMVTGHVLLVDGGATLR